jgi:hypothetical protein
VLHDGAEADIRHIVNAVQVQVNQIQFCGLAQRDNRGVTNHVAALQGDTLQVRVRPGKGDKRLVRNLPEAQKVNLFQREAKSSQVFDGL